MRDSSKQRIERYASSKGHAEVSLAVAEAGLAEARAAMQSMMQHDAQQSGCPFAGAAEATVQVAQVEHAELPWSTAAETMLNSVPAGFCREMTRKAAQRIADQKGLRLIDADFVGAVLETFKSGSQAATETMPWHAAARNRIVKAPDMVRGMLIKEIEGWSRRTGQAEVSGEAVDAVKQIWAARGVFHLDPDDPRTP